MTLKEAFDKQVRLGGETDKSVLHSHLDDGFYDSLLEPYRARGSVAMLEVGVRDGSSLKAWKEWFGETLMLYALDNEAEYLLPKIDGIFLGYADTRKPDTVRDFLHNFGGPLFDVCLDDGSHNPYAQVATFAQIWPSMKQGSIYICEDIEDVSYAQQFKKLFGGEIADRREVKQRHDDICWFKRKN